MAPLRFREKVETLMPPPVPDEVVLLDTVTPLFMLIIPADRLMVPASPALFVFELSVSPGPFRVRLGELRIMSPALPAPEVSVLMIDPLLPVIVMPAKGTPNPRVMVPPDPASANREDVVAEITASFSVRPNAWTVILPLSPEPVVLLEILTSLPSEMICAVRATEPAWPAPEVLVETVTPLFIVIVSRAVRLTEPALPVPAVLLDTVTPSFSAIVRAAMLTEPALPVAVLAALEVNDNPGPFKAIVDKIDDGVSKMIPPP